MSGGVPAAQVQVRSHDNAGGTGDGLSCLVVRDVGATPHGEGQHEAGGSQARAGVLSRITTIRCKLAQQLSGNGGPGPVGQMDTVSHLGFEGRWSLANPADGCDDVYKLMLPPTRFHEPSAARKTIEFVQHAEPRSPGHVAKNLSISAFAIERSPAALDIGAQPLQFFQFVLGPSFLRHSMQAPSYKQMP